MATLSGKHSVPDDYPNRIEMIREAGIAVWDVCHTCVRPGSLDSNICDEIPNEIVQLLADHPLIDHIAFNGQPAFKLFKKHIGLEVFDRGLSYSVMPSTSPANARYSLAEKTRMWSDLVRWL